MTRRLISILLPIVLAIQVATPACSQAPGTSRPKLVLFITIDAMRADYLSRFEPQLTGGLGKLYISGAVFTNAFQDHAITETAPGHSETMSGRFPVHTGISANTAGVNDTTVTLIDAPGPGASPFRFRGTTLWRKQRSIRIPSCARCAPTFFVCRGLRAPTGFPSWRGPTR